MISGGGGMSGASDSSRMRAGGSWRKTSSTADFRGCRKWPEKEKNAPSGTNRRAVSMEPPKECMRNLAGGGTSAKASNNAPHALRQWIVSGRSNSRASRRWSRNTGRWIASGGSEIHESSPHSPMEACGCFSNKQASLSCQPVLAMWACHGWIPKAGSTKQGSAFARFPTACQSASRVALTTQPLMPVCFIAAMTGLGSPSRGSWRWLWESVQRSMIRAD